MTTITKYLEKDLTTDILLKTKKRNVNERTKLDKIILNIGVKEANINSNKILPPLLILKLLTQQQPICTKAKKSISNFKLREGKIIGCKVTLRNSKKQAFLETLVHLILPQLTDSKKLRYKNRRPTNQLTLGLEDTNIFFELENQYDYLPETYGLSITLTSKENGLNVDKLIYSGLKLKFQ
jgi:large subunit ribosomal protein L5